MNYTRNLCFGKGDNMTAIEWLEDLKGHYDNMANRESSMMSQILKDGMNKNIGHLELAIKAIKIDDRRKYIISIYESYKQTKPVREVIEVLKECEVE